ncbi:MAG: hypothetical protein PHR87_00445 [Sulfurospirillaceae bacterium]|nr:hypothetical protein [Sulfurospirillaceae bacterium]
MQIIKKLWILGLCLFLVSGCALKHTISSSQPYLITIKNSHMALSDTGFINFGDAYTNVQIFSAGAILFNLEVSSDVCVDGQCLSRTQFNQLFFNNEHYATLIDDLLHMLPIYNKKNLLKTENGFTQEINMPKSHIIYTVMDNLVTFRDNTNGVLIKLKPLQ